MQRAAWVASKVFLAFARSSRICSPRSFSTTVGLGLAALLGRVVWSLLLGFEAVDGFLDEPSTVANDCLWASSLDDF